MSSSKSNNILKRWNITIKEFTELVDNNGSLRGMMLGYVAEPMLKKMFFEKGSLAQYIGKHDDHHRMLKGDLRVKYKGEEFDFEVKSLQTAKNKLVDKSWTGGTQVDASDCRLIDLPDGSKLKTTNLIYNEFDILAVNIFTFKNKWKFLFIKNKDLPHSRYSKYNEQQKKSLIATFVKVTYPLPKESIFSEDPYQIMDELIEEWKTNGRPPRPKYKEITKPKKARESKKSKKSTENSFDEPNLLTTDSETEIVEVDARRLN